jgi:hypothetical protein
MKPMAPASGDPAQQTWPLEQSDALAHAVEIPPLH